MERKAKQVKAPTPESDITPSDTEEELTFEAMVPEGKEFNTPYPLSDIMEIPKEEKPTPNPDKEYNEKINQPKPTGRMYEGRAQYRRRIQ